MEPALRHYKQAREDFLEAVARFPKELRERRLFGEWNLKDVLAHIIGWEALSIEKVEAVKKETTASWVSDVEAQNTKAVAQYKGSRWEEAYQDLVRSGENMLSAYQSLPSGLWDAQIGPHQQHTPRYFLEKEAGHYENHLQKILSVS